MRAPGLLPLLPLLLLGVSSQDPPPAGAGGDGTTSTDTKNQQTTTATSTGKTPQLSPSISGQTTATATNPGGIIGKSLTTSPTTTTNSLGTTPSTTTVSHNTVKGTTTTANQGNPPPATATPSNLPQQVSPSGTSGAPTNSPPTTQSAGQQQAVPSSRSLRVTTPENTVSTRVSSPAGGLEAAKTSSPSTQAQGSQSLDQLTKATESIGVPRIGTTPGPNSQNVPSSTSDTKQPHSSSSPDKAPTSAAKPGNITTPDGTLNGSLSLTTTTTAPLTSPSNSTRKILEAATLAPGTGAPDQRSHSVGTMSSKATSASRSTASALPSTPAPGDQTVPSSPGLQHPNTSFQNEVVCKDLVQNNESTMYLKEAKTCDEWKMVSNDISFFESFCSTGQHTFNPSRERCTVTLMSPEPRSHQWAVSAVLHLPLDADKVLKQLKDKDKLEELGIANITDKAEREMIINDEFSTPLIITIVTLAGSLLLIATIYGCCHQRFSQKKDQHIHPDLPGFDDGHVALIFNRLTEELQTMENGYHDNPTLEVMETSSEMQEKKVNLNGELGDSWIVPLDTLMKEDLEEEEDTHL